MKRREEYYAYLDYMRESGKINMMEAPKYLVSRFGVKKDEAKEILFACMDLKENK
jgi:hypothetical protein